ncbi:Dynein heavy chain 1, axonemal [Exaiptasia diaphana]|nr:Dynein heavy chain 1, axonemal [Exaiptasia diaphana]
MARTDWVLQWPGQVVIAGCQTFWTKEVTQALIDGKLEDLTCTLHDQLSGLVTLVRGDLSKLARLILGALIVIEVHACDVVDKMVAEGVKSANDFEWISQLRYYWEEDNMVIRAVNAQFDYGYEYLGNTGRLVITPLTDRCYLTLTGALHLKFGGAPAGPAGTGKTETTKDLGKAMAVQCVVFNCSDQLDFMAMGKFFKGLASAGAWACFDEFNRIDVEVLSVVAQQISTIQQALEARVDRFMFEGVELALRPSCAVFITMNPGYAGRTELPDNLKALFRPVAMMVPDYALIAEISLFSFGFSEAKSLAKKITTTFKLSSEQLSSQDHYDFGMRAVKTVISAAGNLKRENPEMSEELIVLRAIRDVNVPKFLQDDLKLFRGIVSDLFPHVKEQPIDYGVLEDSIRKTCLKTGLEDVDGFVTKCIQLYETTVVRHGLIYYWEEDNMVIRAVNAQFDYGYEYLGNTGRLVITPLTDRCYLTLTGALHLKFGGAPAGPAGTGKTETTKDLGKAMAVQCVVFNCSDQLDFMAMGKFFKGLASAGAWACFDEFNRIDVEVLSVVAQQISTIQQALEARVDRFMFEGVELALRPSCAVFITMNPGYAGRTELPDNLKALFRPVAMMVPDYALIAEISLFSFGFSEAKSLAKKITTTFKLSSEQLSSQDHYDFGMRAVKTVISAAGNLKRENPEMSEELIVLRAIRDVNVPKFLQDDLKLFRGIVSDLFPHVKEQPIDYGVLEDSIRKTCLKTGLEDVDGFVTKCIQLYETTVVRHGLMLVGPTGSGKTQCYEILKKAMSSLKGQMSPSGSPFEEVHSYVLNPKSITMGQLYGEFDLLTHEWTDGILSSMIRQGSSSTTSDKKWYIFDGPVDAVWIENMNTVLDDNKKLCLTSGEIIKLSEAMTMMFEVQDLAVASPATVSRCGMVYLEPSILGLKPYVNCYLRRLPDAVFDHKERLEKLFDAFLEDSIAFMRSNMKEFAPTVDSNLTCSLMRLLDCFFEPFVPKEGKTIPQEKIDMIDKLLEPWFIFSLIWAVGGTSDGDGRKKFSDYLRKKMKEEKISMPFPPQGLVYDYKLEDGGVSLKDGDDDEDEEKAKVIETFEPTGEIKWSNWMDGQLELNISQDTKYSDIIVPTMDLVRGSFILEKLVVNHQKVLCVGPTGSGKTLCIADKLLNKMPQAFLSHFLNFSARTSANQTQDIIDGKLDKRRKGVFGPPLGKYYVLFVDDLNMPALEVYGAQPPIEILRQFCDHGGWYDRKAIGMFRELVDITFVCAMGPPGGGRNPVTPRFLRHFNHLSFTELEDASKKRVFSTILKSWLDRNTRLARSTVDYRGEGKELLGNAIVDSTISVYNTVITQLLPTPAKSHYTFNLRDLSKVFQGILMAPADKLTEKADLLRLWYHENCRVFQDRLVNEDDCKWFSELMKEKIEKGFQIKIDDVINESPMIYGDFMLPNADVKVYNEVSDYNKVLLMV